MSSDAQGFVLYKRGEEGESDAWDDTVLIKAYDNAVSAMKAKLAEQHPELAVSNSKPKKKKSRAKAKNKKTQESGGKASHWKVGDLCRAVFSEDGQVYNAKILSIHDDAQTCTLKYVGYGNQEDQLLADLLPMISAESSQDVKTDRTDTASDTGSMPEASSRQENSSVKQKQKNLSSNQKQPHKLQSRRRFPKWPWNSYVQPPAFAQPMPPNIPFQPPPFPGFPNSFPSNSAPQFPGYQPPGPHPPVFPCVPPPPPPLLTDQSEENEALFSMLISWYMSGYHTGYYQGLKQSSAGAAAGHGVHR